MLSLRRRGLPCLAGEGLHEIAILFMMTRYGKEAGTGFKGFKYFINFQESSRREGKGDHKEMARALGIHVGKTCRKAFAEYNIAIILSKLHTNNSGCWLFVNCKLSPVAIQGVTKKS